MRLIADVRAAINGDDRQLAHERLDRLEVEIRAALAKGCPKCKGEGTINVDCDDPQCGDSTWDHNCNEGVEACPACNGTKAHPLLSQ